jgi:signal transduction histidine kinase
VKFSFQGRELKINVRDNGIGFENTEVKGTGILNMRNRAKLIGAFITLESKINEGTQIQITYRKKHNEDVA